MNTFKELFTDTKDIEMNMKTPHEQLQEGFSDSNFKLILTAIMDIVNVTKTKEQKVDGDDSLLMKIKGDLYPDDIDALELEFPGYYFGFDRQKRIITAQKD